MDCFPITDENRDSVLSFLSGHWGSTQMVIRGELWDLSQAAGFLALRDNRIIGLITYLISGDTCEITSLDSLEENKGIGTMLIQAVIQAAKDQRCGKIQLITTNDNLRAIGFYQKRGFDMVRLYHNALENSRELKPQIPLIGEHGIPLKHEIEFELLL